MFINLVIKAAYMTSQTLKTMLGDPRNKTESFEKSGKYEINCNDCFKESSGQSCRAIKKQSNQHLAHIKYGRSEESSVAYHVFNQGLPVDKNSLKFVINVVDRHLFDAYEGLEIVRVII